MVEIKGRSAWVIQSIGQASVIGQRQTSGLTVRQGFLQPKAAVSSTRSAATAFPWDIRVHPNPFGEQLSIDAPEVEEGVLTIEVVDLSGRRIEQHQRSILATRVTLDFGHLRPGAYLLRLQIERKEGSLAQYTTKIIKQ